jgi:glycosyltransferase involved in cell wall biosynthesis
MISIVPGKVSVVLPVRHVNREWLTQSIRSVLEQDYKNLELIVVNDETTEDIDELVNSLRVHKYVKNDRNRKLPYSLNRGFERADGTYHTWTSADNYMLPGMIARLVRELESSPELSIVYSRYNLLTADGDVVEDIERFLRASRIAGCDINAHETERKYTFFSTLGGSFLYKGKVWEQLKYDETLHGAEDYDFWMRASRTFAIGRVPVREPPLYVYRLHSNSISQTVPNCFTTLRIGVLQRELARFPEDEAEIRRAITYYEAIARNGRSFPVRLWSKLTSSLARVVTY